MTFLSVMNDIIANMFSDKFLDEIFKPQELCSKKALKTIFEKLAHTSIMRLNETSMEKVKIKSYLNAKSLKLNAKINNFSYLI